MAGFSAATTADEPEGLTSRFSRSEPTAAATKPGSVLANRLSRTAPGAFTHPPTGEFLLKSPLYPRDSCFTFIWQSSTCLWYNFLINGDSMM